MLAFRQTHFFFLSTDLWKHKASLSHTDIHKATLLLWRRENNTEENKPAIQTRLLKHCAKNCAHKWETLMYEHLENTAE